MNNNCHTAVVPNLGVSTPPRGREMIVTQILLMFSDFSLIAAFFQTKQTDVLEEKISLGSISHNS